MFTRTRKRALADWFYQIDPWTYDRQTWTVPNDRFTKPPNSVFSRSGVRTRSTSVPAGYQITSDEGSTGFTHHVNGKWSGDTGGDFFSKKAIVTLDNGSPITIEGEGVDSNGAWVHAKYHGPFVAVDPQTLVYPVIGETDLTPEGTTAIARCKPTNSVANAGTAVGELFHDGLPKLFGATLWKERTHLAKKAGDEYLNHQFGWLPLVSDVKDVAYAAANSHKILSSYEANAGKVVRRRYEFPVERSKSMTLIQSSDGIPFLPEIPSVIIDSSKPQPKLYKTTETFRRVWFSGAFTYHLPIGYKSRNGMVRAAAKAGPLLGLELTPDVMWNLAPWTWAIDWFSNAGDVVSNLSDWATDGLVMKYGYIMEHCSTKVTYALDRNSRYKARGSYPAIVTVLVETKRRQRATPFGFGLTWNGLSPRQLAIAAALGITRVFQ